MDRKSSKKCPWLITWLRAHMFTGLEFTCRKKSSFMTDIIYVLFSFVRREKHQRLQGLVYQVELRSLESFPKDQTALWTTCFNDHCCLTFGFGWKSFLTLIIQLHCPVMLHDKQKIELSKPAFPLETGGIGCQVWQSLAAVLRLPLFKSTDVLEV